ncbi:MAG: helix-turn-helix transcriptional regulator [Clostridium sp.]|nr:helix-turn-helix transcriptional regulator [Clostridium sp.]
MNNKLLYDEFKKKNIPISKLANECNLAYATCHDILSGKKKNPSIKSAYKIASYLNVSIDNLMEDSSDEKSSVED